MRRAIFLGIFLAAITRAARASDTDLFGFGARATSMGGAFTALATDFTGTYYNPAGPAARSALTAGAALSYASYALDFRSQTGSTDHDVTHEPSFLGLALGVASPLDADPSSIFSRFAPGLGIFLPVRNILDANLETAPGVPQFFMYGARQDKLSLLPSLGIRILPIDPDGEQTLAVGVGASVLADLSGSFSFDLSAVSARSVIVDAKLKYDAAPNFGIFYWPLSWLSLGVAYRGQIGVKADFDVQILVNQQNLFPLQLEAVALYQPQQIQGGFAIDPLDWLTISADLTWANWSRFRDPFATIRPVVPQADVTFRDVFTPRVGVEVEPFRGFAIRGGYYYQPSAIPPQSGSTNLIDLDKHVLSAGIGYTYWSRRERIARDAEGVAKIETDDHDRFSIDAFFQWHHLLSQHVEKDPGASPTVGTFYDVSGEIYSIGLQLTLRI